MSELWVPAATALGALTAIALTKNVLSYADWVVNRGLGAGAVGAIALYQVVPLVAQTLPFSVLLGALVGLGRLKADREILVMRASGIPPGRLVAPVLAFASAVTLVGVLLSTQVAPAARAALFASLERMRAEQPGVALRAGTTHGFQGRQLLAREVSASGDRLRGVLLWTPDVGETIFAEQAEVSATGQRSIRLTLLEGVILSSPRDGARSVRFQRFATELTQSQKKGSFGDEEDRFGAASGAELRAVAAASEGDARSRRLASAELQRRLALPLATLIFGLMAVPLAFTGERFSRSSGGVIGLGITVAYYGLAQLGNGLLRFPSVPVEVAVWVPVGVGSLVAVWLLARLARQSSGVETRRERKTRGVETTAPESERAPRTVTKSRTRALDRYVLSTYVRLALISFAALFVAYLVLDVLERLEWFAKHQAEFGEVLHFYSARGPVLAARVVPLSLLAGATLTVSLLAAHGELVAMQACGIRLARVLVPILAVSALAVPANFAFNDLYVTRANARADRIKVDEIKDGGLQSTSSDKTLWYRIGDRLVRASRLGLETGSVKDLTVYELGKDGFPVSRIDAASATELGDGLWALTDAQRVELSPRGLEWAEAPDTLQIGEAPSAELDTTHLTSRELAQQIEETRARDYDVTAYEVDLHRRLAASLACFLLPLIAILQALRSTGRMGTARSLLISGGLAIAYLMIGDLFTALGYGGQLPPAVAGWAPPAVLAGVGLLLVPRAQR